MSSVVELRRISKAYPGVQALAEVSLSLQAGSIHGLIGENGAGKSTLMKIVAGLERPDSGEILIDGRPVRLRSLHNGLRYGISLVYQEIQLVPESSVAENVMLDKLPTRWGGRIDWPALREKAHRFVEAVGLTVPVDTPARELSAAQQKLVQIARALAGEARVLLLDEPTAALTRHEAQMLLGILRDLRSRGIAMAYVSHRLEEVIEACDRISVLRDGRLVGASHGSPSVVRGDEREVGGTVDLKRALVTLMVGREYREQRIDSPREALGREVLRAEDVRRGDRVRGVSFALHEGEILGFYGLVGAGRTEAARAIIGADPMDSGRVLLHGEPVRIASVGQAIHRHRIGYVPENRKEEGLLLEEAVGTNIGITLWRRLRRRITRSIDRQAELRTCSRMVDQLAIKCTGLDQPVKDLSGGNQQKVCLAKWLASDSRILIIDEPTVGVDVGAKQQIHQLIRDLAQQGKAIILISSDLPEMLQLAGRIMVFRDGRIVGEVADAPGRDAEAAAQAIGGFLA